jgi:hypothetical protein
MRHNIEIGTGEYLDNLTVNAAALLYDVVQALELTETQTQRILGQGYSAITEPIEMTEPRENALTRPLGSS